MGLSMEEDSMKRPTSDERSRDRPCNGLRDRRERAGCRGLLWQGDSSIPLCVRDALAPIIRQLQALNEEIAVSDRAIIELVKTDARSKLCGPL